MSDPLPMRTFRLCGRDIPGCPYLIARPHSLPGSIQDVLLLVLLEIQNHHHTAREKGKRVSAGQHVSSGMTLSLQKSPHVNKTSSQQKIFSGFLFLLQTFMMKILGHLTLLIYF